MESSYFFFFYQTPFLIPQSCLFRTSPFPQVPFLDHSCANGLVFSFNPLVSLYLGCIFKVQVDSCFHVFFQYSNFCLLRVYSTYKLSVDIVGLTLFSCCLFSTNPICPFFNVICFFFPNFFQINQIFFIISFFSPLLIFSTTFLGFQWLNIHFQMDPCLIVLYLM